MLGDPAGDEEADPLADVDGVVADALVEAGDDRQLHGDLQLDLLGGVAGEDRLDELALQVVEVAVHVGEGGGARRIVGEVGLGGLLEQLVRLSRPSCG